MSKKKQVVPKTNKFTIKIDPLVRPSALVMDMIQKGKSATKVIPNKKKKENKDSCRDNKNLEE